MAFRSYAQQLLEEGREEGEQRGKMKAVEGLLRIGLTWDVIEAATGLNESGFQILKERLSASDSPPAAPLRSR